MQSNTTVTAPPRRIELVDALRGSALVGIFLLHCIEHFDFSVYPKTQPGWLAGLNLQTKEALFFLFGGKAYAIFAMMFGLSFSIIMDRAARRGVDFQRRFLWRLCVLAIMGYVFGLIFCGEIMTMLAVVGVPLAFLYGVRTRWLMALSILLLLQVPYWWQLLQTVGNAEHRPFNLNVGSYYRLMYPVFENEGFLRVIEVNAWTSVLGRNAGALGNGRYLQMLGLFIWGLVLGRYYVFERPELAQRLAIRALAVALIAFGALYVAQGSLPLWELTKTQTGILKKLLASYLSLAHMVVWVTAFVLLYQLGGGGKYLRVLVPFGRLSLTNYILQNALGVFLFYHFGAGLFRHWGQFYSLLFGVVFLVLQYPVLVFWLRHFHYGPFEWLWRSLTQLSFQTPLRRAPAPSLLPDAKRRLFNPHVS